jgi:HD-GYP domain-containing protein (c-di-GMP phosphodiesterase class II)
MSRGFALRHLSIQFCGAFADSAPVKRARTKARRLLEKLGLGSDPDLHPAMQDAIERRSHERRSQMARRERTAEFSLAFLVLAGGTALALFAPASRHFDPRVATAFALAMAIASRVRFHDGAGYTTPSQLVFVPMLLLLPPSAAPLLVAVSMMAGNLHLIARGELHLERVTVSLGDAWYTLGPAAVLAFAAPAHPSWHALPIYVAALGAQFACDLLSSVFRDWFVVGLGTDLGLPLITWTWLVDSVLSSVGLLAALAARDDPLAALLVLPLVALLAVFSRERDARIEQSLELSRAYRGTTLLLSDVLDGDDEYTAFHSRGVVQLAMAVADRLGLDERQKRNVEFGALLHDVGKIAIPKEILNKPGKLTKDEWFVMEAHTVEGQKMLDRVGGVLGDVGQIVRSSHERWDGGGYPDGLAGAEIPVESTIVSVCDAFNAMTTHRPYRRALSIQEARKELTENSGSQFAPHVVDVLLELLDENAGMVGPAAPESAAERELDEITLVVPQPLPKPAA